MYRPAASGVDLTGVSRRRPRTRKGLGVAMCGGRAGRVRSRFLRNDGVARCGALSVFRMVRRRAGVAGSSSRCLEVVSAGRKIQWAGAGGASGRAARRLT